MKYLLAIAFLAILAGLIPSYLGWGPEPPRKGNWYE